MAPTPGSLVPPLVRRMSPAILYILKLTLGHKKDILIAASALDDTFGALKEGNKWNKVNDTIRRIEECKRTLLDERPNTALTLQQKREFWLKPTSEGIPAKPSVAKAKKRKRERCFPSALLSEEMGDPPSPWSLSSAEPAAALLPRSSEGTGMVSSCAPATGASSSSLSAGRNEVVSAVNNAALTTRPSEITIAYDDGERETNAYVR